MKRVGLKYLKIYKDRHGKLRCYHRKAGLTIDIKKYPLNSPEFIAEYSRITTSLKNSANVKAGTLGKLILEYKKHASFNDLATKTKADYERYFLLLKNIFDTPLERFNTPLVVKIRDRVAAEHGRRSANYLKTVMSIVFSWGKERGFCEINPAHGIKAIKQSKDAPYANRPWADNERDVVLDALPKHMRLPILLMMMCGLDPKDAVLLPKSAIRNELISTRRIKTGQPVWIPLPTIIRDEIETAKNESTVLCVNSKGKPWTISGFRASWRKIKNNLESQGMIGTGLTLKGLRHTVATILAEMGYDDRTIADMLGQRTTAMAQHYSRAANRTKKLTPVVLNLAKEVKSRKKLSNLIDKSV